MATHKASLLATIGLSREGFTRGLHSAMAEAKTFAGNFKNTLQTAVGTGFGFLGANAIQGALGGVTNFLKSQAREAIVAAASFEQLQMSYKVLIGDADVAAKSLADLVKYSDITPYTTSEVTQAGKLLLAYGIEADDLRNKIGRLGEMASSVNRPLMEIAQVYGRAAMQGKVYMRNVYQFQMRGIPIIKALGAVYKKTEQQTIDWIKSGQIGAKELDAAIENLTNRGGRFFGMMIEQSRTTSGLWSTLTGYVELLHKSLGKPMLPALNSMMNVGIAMIPRIAPLMEKIGEKVGAALKQTFNVIMGIVTSGIGIVIPLLQMMGNVAIRFVGNMVAHVGMRVLWPLVYAAFRFGYHLGESLIKFGASALRFFQSLWQSVGKMMLGSLISAMARFMITARAYIEQIFRAVTTVDYGKLFGAVFDLGKATLTKNDTKIDEAKQRIAGFGIGFGINMAEMLSPEQIAAREMAIAKTTGLGKMLDYGQGMEYAGKFSAAADSGRARAEMGDALKALVSAIGTGGSQAMGIVSRIPGLAMQSPQDLFGMAGPMRQLAQVFAALGEAGKKAIEALKGVNYEEEFKKKKFEGTWGTSLNRPAYNLTRRRTAEEREFASLEAKLKRKGELSPKDAKRYEELESRQKKTNDLLEGIGEKMDAMLEAMQFG